MRHKSFKIYVAAVMELTHRHFSEACEIKLKFILGNFVGQASSVLLSVMFVFPI